MDSCIAITAPDTESEVYNKRADFANLANRLERVAVTEFKRCNMASAKRAMAEAANARAQEAALTSVLWNRQVGRAS